MLWIHTWIFETAQIIAFSGKNAVTASFSKDGVFCCDEAHAGRKQKETASLSVQTASLGVQTASFPVHGFCTTHKTAFFFDYGVFSLKNASGKNLCRLKIQVSTMHHHAPLGDCAIYSETTVCQHVLNISEKKMEWGEELRGLSMDRRSRASTATVYANIGSTETLYSWVRHVARIPMMRMFAM